MSVSGVSNDRNYTNMLNSSGNDKVQTENLAQKYGVTFTTEDSSSLSIDDFFTIMITQLTNQDFMNPTSNDQYMTQMTQYASLQAMQEMAQYTRQNYAMSMVGKTVTASKYSNGKHITETGVVEQLIKTDNEYQVKVNGNMFTIGQVQTVEASEKGNDVTDSTTGESGQMPQGYNAMTALG